MRSYLVLEDGSIFEGRGFGATGIAEGELVFETGMSGYVESLTDPSYNGQMLMFTYPLIGNYGVDEDCFESDGVKCSGVIVKECCSHPSHWKSEKSLEDLLKDHQIPALQGIDTRMITKRVREKGTMRAVLSVGMDRSKEELVDRARSIPKITDRHGLVEEVSTTEPLHYGSDDPNKIVMIDCGYKKSILEDLLHRGYDVVVVPYDTSPEDIISFEPQAVLVSNGPGDPTMLDTTIDTVKELIGEVPLFGICLGHLLIGLACGADTFKLKYGHRGINHPVKHLKTGKVFITTQNHGFALSDDSLIDLPLNITQINLNDGTIEGIEHDEFPVKGLQYHPEASPGPHDTRHFFEEMKKIIEKHDRKEMICDV